MGLGLGPKLGLGLGLKNKTARRTGSLLPSHRVRAGSDEPLILWDGSHEPLILCDKRTVIVPDDD